MRTRRTKIQAHGMGKSMLLIINQESGIELRKTKGRQRPKNQVVKANVLRWMS